MQNEALKQMVAQQPQLVADPFGATAHAIWGQIPSTTYCASNLVK